MSLMNYVKQELPILASVISDVEEPLMEVYLCPSYIDDDGVLQDCKCGGKCNER